MDNKAPEEGGTGLGTATPPGEAEEPGRTVTTDVQRDGREKLPPSAPPPQPKLNGGQQPPAGVPTHFDPAFRSMMPPYVSLSFMFWTDHITVSLYVYLVLSLRDDSRLCLVDVPRLSSDDFCSRASKLQIPCSTRRSEVSSRLHG